MPSYPLYLLHIKVFCRNQENPNSQTFSSLFIVRAFQWGTRLYLIETAIKALLYFEPNLVCCNTLRNETRIWKEFSSWRVCVIKWLCCIQALRPWVATCWNMKPEWRDFHLGVRRWIIGIWVQCQTSCNNQISSRQSSKKPGGLKEQLLSHILTVCSKS